MTPTELPMLARLTVTDPAGAAKQLLAQGYGREVVWTAFALVIVANTLLVTITFLGASNEGLQGLFASPVTFLPMLALSLVLVAGSVTLVGLLFGGKGRFEDILLLIVWLQALRVLVQMGLLVLTPISGVLSSLAAMAVSILGLWILVNFIYVAHQLDALWRAAVVFILGIIGMGIALSILLSFLGLSNLDIIQYV